MDSHPFRSRSGGQEWRGMHKRKPSSTAVCNSCLSVCFVGREVNHVCVAFRKKNWKSLEIALPLLGLGKKGDLLTYLETFAHTRGVMGTLNILLMSYERGGKTWLCLEGIHNIDRYTLTHSRLHLHLHLHALTHIPITAGSGFMSWLFIRFCFIVLSRVSS